MYHDASCLECIQLVFLSNLERKIKMNSSNLSLSLFLSYFLFQFSDSHFIFRQQLSKIGYARCRAPCLNLIGIARIISLSLYHLSNHVHHFVYCLFISLAQHELI